MPNMREVELRVADGEFVAVVEVPPYPDEGMPQVVLWGERCFARLDVEGDVVVGWVPLVHRGRWVYGEASLTVSATPSPGLPL